MAGDGATLDEIPQMTGHSALGQLGERGELSHGRETPAGAIGEADQALHRPSEARLQRAVDVKGDGNKGKQNGLPDCKAARPGSRSLRAQFACGKTRLAKFGEVGKSQCRQNSEVSRFAGICRPAFPGGLVLYGSRVSRSSANNRAGLRGQRERGAIIFRLQPARLRLLEHGDVSSLSPAEQLLRLGNLLSPARGDSGALLGPAPPATVPRCPASCETKRPPLRRPSRDPMHVARSGLRTLGEPARVLSAHQPDRP
jgi:hypothetical protein